MRIRYTHHHGTSVTSLPKHDPLARHAAEAYSYVLNTDTHRNRWHTAREFADAIREVMDCEKSDAIVSHLSAMPN